MQGRATIYLKGRKRKIMIMCGPDNLVPSKTAVANNPCIAKNFFQSIYT